MQESSYLLGGSAAELKRCASQTSARPANAMRRAEGGLARWTLAGRLHGTSEVGLRSRSTSLVKVKLKTELLYR